jgi:Universal stress protein family
MARDTATKALSPRRIVVGLEALPRSRAALRAAADIAARTQAELIALFVEDANLLEWAGLPFAREVGFPSAVARTLDAAAMERRLRALAQQTERSLEELARGTSLRWSYRVARGALMTELLAAAAENDLVVASAVAEWTPRRLAASAHAAVLVVQELVRPGTPVVAACSSALPPAEAARMLQDMASVLGHDHEVTVALLCESPEGAARWVDEVRKRAPDLRLQVGAARDETELQARLAALRRPVVVLPEAPPGPAGDQAARSSRPRSRRRSP